MSDFLFCRAMPNLMRSLVTILYLITTTAHSSATGTGRVVEFDIPGKAGSTHEISAGPNGNLWITQQKNGRLVKVTVDGRMEIYDLPKGSGPHGLKFDAQGRMWITLEFVDEIAQVGLDGQIVARHKVPLSGAGPHGLGIGLDGNVWWTGKTGNVIGRLNPVTGRMDVFPLDHKPAKPIYIAPGPNGNMWFTELEGSRIGRITPKGQITTFPIPTENARPIVVFTGPKGRIWFTEERGNAFGTVTAEGEIMEYPTGVAGGMLAGATFDKVGNLQLQFNKPDIIQRIAPDKTVVTYRLPSKNAVQHRITVGPNGRVWFTELVTDKVGHIQYD